MSDGNALAAVTATMKSLLKSRLPESLGGSPVDVSTESPIALTRLGPSDTTHRLNLFLYEVRPCAAFRNTPPPAARVGSSGQVPLALELYYMLSPYPVNDDNEQVGQQLLGMGLLALHDLSVVGAQSVRLTDTDPPQDLFGELLRIAPITLNGEEMSRLWSALQAPLRPSAAFQVSPVLIQSQQIVKSAPPVLRRGPSDSGADVGGSLAVVPEAKKLELVPPNPNTARRRPDNLPVFEPGERVRLSGSLLVEAGQSSRVLLHRQDADDDLDIEMPQVAALSNASAIVFDLVAPAATQLSAGIYTVRVDVPRTVQTTPPAPADSWSSPRTTNELPILLAPRISTLAFKTPSTGPQIGITCTPPLSAGQRVLLFVGDRPLALSSQSGDGASLTFLLPTDQTKLPSGTYVVRLRVDGVDSLASTANDPYTFVNTVTLQ